jgi:hypothetical protein
VPEQWEDRSLRAYGDVQAASGLLEVGYRLHGRTSHRCSAGVPEEARSSAIACEYSLDFPRRRNHLHQMVEVASRRCKIWHRLHERTSSHLRPELPTRSSPLTVFDGRYI